MAVFGESFLTKSAIAISNHSSMLGGGEHSFLDLLSHILEPWNILAVVPGEGELATRLKQKRVETEVIPLPPIRPWHLLSILLSLKRYFDLFSRYRPALVYANGSRAALYGGIVGRILNLPVIWHCRIADPDIHLDFILRRLSSRVIANSWATAKRFREPFQSKVRVIYNGVNIGKLRDDSIFRPGFIGDAWKVILVVARVSRWKRHDLALTAFEQIAAREPDAHLVCVGSSDALEPDWWDYLQERSHQSAFSNRIHWIGHVADVRPWYRAASVLLLCSENEAFGRVIVEAMACGVPVIATRSGGVPEIVRHGQDGLLVPPGNTSEITIAIEEILKDKEMKTRLSESARKRALSFSLDAHVNNMLEIMDETIKN